MCTKDLPVDNDTFVRMRCCGRALHFECRELFFGQVLDEHQKPNQCPGCGVLAEREKSFAQVQHWVEHDKPWAFAHLANKYLFGNGVAQSSAKALQYYYQAVQHGDPNGMCQLATMYYSGARGVEKDLTLAHKLFTCAAQLGTCFLFFPLVTQYCCLIQSTHRLMECFSLFRYLFPTYL